VVLDYDGVSKHHAEIFLKEKAQEAPDASTTTLAELLSVRDLGSKNAVAVRTEPHSLENPLPLVTDFQRVPAGSSQALQDGFSLLIPSKSRQGAKQMSVEKRLLTVYISVVMIDIPAPQPKPVVSAPVPSWQPQATVMPAASMAKKKKIVTRLDAPQASAPATLMPEAELSDPEGQDLPPPQMLAAPIPAKPHVPPAVGPGQRPLTSPRPERRRAEPKAPVQAAPVMSAIRSVEVLSDEENLARAPMMRLTAANVAAASAAAAKAAGAREAANNDDPELRSISPISAPGVFPWQQQTGKKGGKKKVRAESPASGEPRPKKKRKVAAEGTKAGKAKKPLLRAAPAWDPYMPREASPSPCSTIGFAVPGGRAGKNTSPDRFAPASRQATASKAKKNQDPDKKKKKNKDKDGAERTRLRS
jgi:hypothetical protein